MSSKKRNTKYRLFVWYIKKNIGSIITWNATDVFFTHSNKQMDKLELLLTLNVEKYRMLLQKTWDKLVKTLENISKTDYDKNGQNIAEGVNRLWNVS